MRIYTSSRRHVYFAKWNEPDLFVIFVFGVRQQIASSTEYSTDYGTNAPSACKFGKHANGGNNVNAIGVNKPLIAWLANLFILFGRCPLSFLQCAIYV